MKKIKVMHFVAGLTSGGVEQMLCNYCGAMNKDAYEFVLAYQHQAVETCKEKIEESGCRTIRITARSENFIKNLIDGYRVIKKAQVSAKNIDKLMKFINQIPEKRDRIKIASDLSEIL